MKKRWWAGEKTRTGYCPCVWPKRWVQRKKRYCSRLLPTSREDLEFFYAHIGEAKAHGEPVFDMVREYTTTDECQQKIRDNLKTWCDKFQAAQEGGYRVSMGVDAGVRVDL